MLLYERTDISERIYFDKIDKSKEFMMSHYWYFKNNVFHFENIVCSGCHDISMICYELKNIAIFRIKGINYRCIL